MNDLPKDSNSPQGFSISSLIQPDPQNGSTAVASDGNSQTASQQVPSDATPISEVSINPQLKGDADDVEVQNILASATEGAITEAKNESPIAEQSAVSNESPVSEASIAPEPPPINEVKIEDSGKDDNLDLDSSTGPVVFNSIAAFVAGLVVVGIFYAYSVNKNNVYTSQTLGVQNEMPLEN